MTVRSVRLISFLSILIIAAAVTFSQLVYPVRVTFDYTYNGHKLETSYLTLVRMSLGDPEISLIRWDPVRNKVSTPLSDGSVLMLMPEWPFQWQNFQRGVSYKSRARWMWMNDPRSPTEIVYADGASRLAPQHAADPPFVWTEVSASVERLSEASFIQAVVDDRKTDDPIALLASSYLGFNFGVTGRLYAGIEASPLQGKGLQEIKELDGWVDLQGGCRLFVRKLGLDVPAANGLVRQFADNHILMRHADLWSGDDGPRSNEVTVMYPAGSPQLDANGSTQSYVRPVLQQIHAIEFQGKICSGIALPTDSNAAYLDFGEGRVVGIYPSLRYTVLK